MYYKGAKAALVCYDITSYETFTKAKEWINELHEQASADIVIAMVGNKCDLNDQRKVKAEEVQDYCDSNGLENFEVSAKTGENINNVF